MQNTLIIFAIPLLSFQTVFGYLVSDSEPWPADKLVGLGMVDGKEIFFGKTYRNWTESKEYCKVFRMRLLEISSQEQQDFLETRFSHNGFMGLFWTAGRDVLSPTRFVWDGSENKMGNYSQAWGFQSGIAACVAYSSTMLKNAIVGMWESYPCSSQKFVLCEKYESLFNEHLTKYKYY